MKCVLIAGGVVCVVCLFAVMISFKGPTRVFEVTDLRIIRGNYSLSVYDAQRHASMGGPLESFGLSRHDLKKIEKTKQVKCWYEHVVSLMDWFEVQSWPRCRA